MPTAGCRQFLFFGCAAWCLSGLLGCGGSRSPEKVYETWSTAVKAGNFAGSWECLTPQTRGTVLQIMVLDADLLSGANPGAKQAFGEVFSKYGLNSQDAAFAQQRLQVANAAAYAADLNNVFRQFQHELTKLEGSRFQKLSAIWNASAQSPVAVSQQQGLRATAAVQGKIPHTAENSTVQAVFEKVNGQWLFAELEESAGAAAVAGGPPGAAAGMPGPAGRPGMAGMPEGKVGPPGAEPGLPGAQPGANPGAMLMQRGDENNAFPGGVDPKNLPANRPGGPMPGMAGADPNGQAMPARPGAGPGGPGMVGKAGEGEKAMPANPGELPGRAMIGKAGEDEPKAMPANPGGLPGERAMIGRPGENEQNAGAGGNQGEPGLARAGGADGAGAGGNQNKPKQGTWQYAVWDFKEKVASGNYSGLDYTISARAKGLLLEIRNDEVSDERKDDLKATFAEASPLESSVKNTGSAISLSLKGKLGHTIQLSVSKEDGVFKVRDLKISEPGATKKR